MRLPVCGWKAAAGMPCLSKGCRSEDPEICRNAQLNDTRSGVFGVSVTPRLVRLVGELQGDVHAASLASGHGGTSDLPGVWRPWFATWLRA